MELKKIIVLSIFLLAILTITPLCASDNAATDDLSINDANSDSYSTEFKNIDDIIGDGDNDPNENENEEIPDNELDEDELDEDESDEEELDDEEDVKILDLKVSCPKQMYINNPTKITFTGPKDYWGEVTVKVDNKIYTGDYEDGKCTVWIKALKTGTNTISYTADLFDGYASGTFKITANKKPIIQASAITMFSTQSKNYKIRLLDANKKPLAYKLVTFYRDYTKLKTVKTDKNGYASIKLSKLEAYTSDLKIKYDGVTFTKKLTVKSIFKSFKSAKVKNAKKLTLQISTKKVGGKYLKNKVVTIKVKGKTFKAKINSKGIVKLTIDKKVFAKCSTSKYAGYIVLATLGKDSINAGISFSKVKPTLSYKITPNIGVGGA